jgi:hypothetical protein
MTKTITLSKGTIQTVYQALIELRASVTQGREELKQAGAKEGGKLLMDADDELSKVEDSIETFANQL